MKRCNKCKMIMGDGAKVCLSCNQKLGNDFTYICNNCGQVINGKDKKCSRCGAPTIFDSMEVDFNTETLNNNLQQTSNSKIAKIFICSIFAIIVLFVVYQLGASNSNEKKSSTEYMKQETTKSVEKSNSPSTIHKEEKRENIIIGYVNGDDVFIRNQPSTDGKPITMVNKRTQVEVLDSQGNSVASTTYILKADNCIGYDLNSTQKFTLNNGLTLKYESPGKYPNQAYCKIQTAVGEKTIAINNFSNVAEKITNNDWYKVRLSDGKIGWIYGKFVDISEMEK